MTPPREHLAAGSAGVAAEAAAEALYGTVARRLNPRALPQPSDPSRRAAAADAESARALLVFDATAATAAEREALASVAHARSAPFVPADRLAADFEIREVAYSAPLAELAQLAHTVPAAGSLVAAQRALLAPPGPPSLMGVLNLTPDSFSDGGRYPLLEQALRRAEEMAQEGAAWIDVGGESTRPGAAPVDEDEELRRVLPLLEALERRALPALVSIDTRKARVARAALERGARMVNDVSGGTHDERMLPLLAEHADARFCVMHMRGEPRTMQQAPHYRDVVAEVAAWLREQVAACRAAGIPPSRIVLDPGIGFGKRLADNLGIMRRLPELRSLARPLLLGVSRKSFITQVAPEAVASAPAERLGGTAAAVAWCVRGGAEILRVHDVAAMQETLNVSWALARPDEPTPTRGTPA